MKIAASVAALGVAFLGGFFLAQKFTPTKVIPVVSTAVEEKEVTRTVVKTLKPDGTVIVKEVDTNRTQKQESVKNVSVPQTKFRFGIGIRSDVNFNLTPQANVGYRLSGPNWLDFGYAERRVDDKKEKDFTIGYSREL